MSKQVSAIAIAFALGLSAIAHAAVTEQRLKEDKVHVRTWNTFADECLALQKQQLAQTQVREKTRIGGYAHQPQFYIEHTYYDAKTGVLLSRMQWEREHPDRMHTCEVYIYDDQGRVVRDFAAAYLPQGRNAPVQTLINLHEYNGDLHAFRQFDASGDRIYEYCEGTWHDKPVQLRIFEDDLYGTSDVTSTPVYSACFKGLPMKAGEYLDPH